MNLNGIHFSLSKMTTSKVPIRTSGSTTVTKMSMVQIKPTYCNVDSNARRFPSFPFDHLLTSGSRNSANLCTKKNIPCRKGYLETEVFFLNFLMTNSLTCFSACSLWASMSRMFFSARALAWKLIMMRITRDYRTQNTEQVEETTVHWSIPLAQLCVDASPILLYVSELTQPQLL